MQCRLLARTVALSAVAVSVAFFTGCGAAPVKVSSAPPSPTLGVLSENDSHPTVNSETTAELESTPTAELKIAVVLKSPAAEDVPKDLHPPKIVLSSGHAATCLIKQGDPFPNLTLPDLQGKQVRLPSAYGDRLTVVVFWNLQQSYARDQFSRLQGEVVDLYRPFGVSVVAINEGDTPADISAFAQQVDFTATCLYDADGNALRKVATGKLPRTYLLDASGAVLWFDIEYSFATRRELRNAIHWALRDKS